MRTLILILVLAIVLSCGAVSAQCAPTNIPLTTPAGVCTFIADSYTTVPPSAKGKWGPDCPGYIAPPPPPGSCGPEPAGRKLPTYQITFVPQNVKSFVNSGKYSSTFGWVPAPSTYPTSEDAALAWPGVPVTSTITVSLPPSGSYVALEFTTPAAMTSKLSGAYVFNQTGSSITGTMSIDPCPGVFSAPKQGRCWGSGGEGQGVSFASSTYASSDRPLMCILQPGTKYYLNYKVETGASCSAGCAIGIKHMTYGL